MTESNSNCISTGNDQMDEILNGGFPANSINIIMGHPGTGKTVFAEQMVFHHAHDADRPILYLTTLSEPVSKVLTYLQNFDFYDQDKIASSVHYQDIGSGLAQNGIKSLVPILRELIHDLAPKIIVIDSFKAFHDLAESKQEMRRMLFEVTGMLAAYEATVFLIGEYTEEDSITLPEFAIADGILQFLRSSTSTRDERFVRVLKLRGSKYLEGLHGCCITKAGVEIYPRLLSPKVGANYSWQQTRVKSGVPGLDKVLEGGLLRGSTTLVAGLTGSGKTTMALQFVLQGIENKERCLYVNFQENPTQLMRSIRALGFDGNDGESRGLSLFYRSPVELQIDGIVVEIFQIIEKEKIERIVIDSLGDLEIASSDAERLHDYIYSLSQHLSVKGVTSMYTYETSGNLLEGFSMKAGARFSNMSDNIIVLGTAQFPDFQRQLLVLKSRGSGHDLKAQNFILDSTGLTVS